MRVDDGVLLGHQRLGAEADAIERAERHDQRPAVAEADDFARHLGTAAAGEVHAGTDADGAVQAGDLDQQALHARNAAVGAVVGDAGEFGEQAFHAKSADFLGSAPSVAPRA